MATKANTSTEYNWREDMKKAGELKDRAATNNKQASARLWRAAQAGITEWIPNADDDVSGENLYNEFISAYGESRKGDCSKMKTVALAVLNNGLTMGEFDNLSKAYAEARRLTQTVKTEKAEDVAADEAVTKIAETAPKSSSKPEGAAMIVLAKGVDEAARLLLDALGADNTPAHRSLMRAISQEIAGRTKPEPKVKKTAETKEGATKAKVSPAPKAGATKAKPASAKAKAAEATLAEKAAAAGVTGTPKAKPAKAKSVKAEPAPVEDEPIDDLDDIEDNIEDDFFNDEVDEDFVDDEVDQTPAPAKAKPVVRRPVRR
jgi:hypothetical protein